MVDFMENPIYKWRMNRATPISGNLHVHVASEMSGMFLWTCDTSNRPTPAIPKPTSGQEIHTARLEASGCGISPSQHLGNLWEIYGITDFFLGSNGGLWWFSGF